jgi:C-terminal processing protease CtpA/Prc
MEKIQWCLTIQEKYDVWAFIQHYNRQIRKSMYKRTCSDNNEIIRAVSKILSGRNYKHISYINFSNANNMTMDHST